MLLMLELLLLVMMLQEPPHRLCHHCPLDRA
jgi:hypothetical protein